MNETTRDVIETGQAYIKILKGFEVLEPKAKWFERLLIRLLKVTYQQRLRYLVGVLPGDVSDEILKGEL